MAEYNPAQIEKKWQQFWEKNNTFSTDKSSGDPLYVLDMFPYPSGSGLHMGHPLGYTGTDIYCRFKRSQGYSVLHPMGYDAFGLPAEQHAISTGEHPAEVTQMNCNRFTQQLKELGLSYDWDREVRTCDPSYYKWTQWIFLKLYNSWFDSELQKARPIEELSIPEEVKKEGEKAVQEYQAGYRLAYMDEALVNWCPALGTVLANEEVIDGRSERGGHEIIRKPMRQWFLRITKYSERLLSELEEINWPENIKEQQRNWIGKRFGTEINFKVVEGKEVLPAFTTRPDTLFGVTFFVISPEHPLVTKLTTEACKERVEAYCDRAAHLSDLDRTIENREKTGEFIGSYVINPVNGAEVPIYVGDYVLMSYGTGAVMGVPAHDERDFAFALKFGVPVRPVIKPEKENSLSNEIIAGNACWTEPGVMIELEDSQFTELGLNGISSELAKEKINAWLEANNSGRAVVNYRLRDWLFSRQRYWGEPIPLIHWEDGTLSAVPESELPLTLPEVDEYRPAETGESPLARATGWLEVTCASTGKKGRRETNTMPQWAGSCWYYLRFLDPKNDSRAWDPELERQWMPVDLYVGGAEHAVLHLLYARFWHKVLFDLGYVSQVEPFQRLFNQGMLVSYAYRDSRGALIPVDEVNDEGEGKPVHIKTGETVEKITAKMSKSLRNVINPDEVIQEYGTDTLRTYLMFMGPLEGMKHWDSQAIMGNYRFLKRAWAFLEERKFIESDAEDQEIVKARHAAIKKVTEDTDSLRFNTAIAGLMEFLNSIGAKDISRQTGEAFVVLLSPYAPHLAEELWEVLGNQPSVQNAPWPVFDESLLVKRSTTVVVQVNGKKRSSIEVAVNIDDEQLRQLIIEHMAGGQYPVDNALKFITVRDKKQDNLPKLVNVICK